MPKPNRPLDLPGYDGEEGRLRASSTPLEWAQLLLHAARRRGLVFAGVLFACLGATAVSFFVRTPTYHVEAKVLAQRQQALPSVVRSVYDDLPTRSAWELIHRRENLAAIIRQAKLQLEGGDASARGVGLGERLLAWLRRSPRPVEPDSPEDVLVRILDEKLAVTVEEGTITIEIYWPDPDEAYQIVLATVQNFLEARHVQEVASIDEVISVMEGRAASLREELEKAVAEARVAAARPARPPHVRQPSEELVRLQSLLEAKERAIQDVEAFRRRRLADLQAQLDQARNTLSDAHPTVISLRKDIAALSVESPQIDILRAEEQKLRQQLSARMAQEGFQGTPAVVAAPVTTLGANQEEDQRVREARLQYEQMLARINTAQVERGAARAAFKYRYNVIWPPQVPKEPATPNPKKLFLLGGFASLVLAFLAVAAPDLVRGRILERWQVEKGLDLPIVGEIRRD